MFLKSIEINKKIYWKYGQELINQSDKKMIDWMIRWEKER